MEKILFATNAQKAIDFFIEAGNDWFERAIIEKKTGLSKAGANLALKELLRHKLIARDKKASAYIYRLDAGSFVIKQLKVLKTLAKLSALADKLKPLSQKIILFGSMSRGENLSDSDIDLFILTRSEAEAKKIIKASRLSVKVQLIAKTASELELFKKNDPYFFKEIDRGITLWQKI